MRHVLLVLLLLGACSDDEGYYQIEYYIHAQRPFDHWYLWMLDEPGSGPAPLTPALIATGTEPPAGAVISTGLVIPHRSVSPATHASVWTSRMGRIAGVAAVVSDGDQIVGGVVDEIEDSEWRDDGLDGLIARGTLEIELVPIEVWNQLSPYGMCARISNHFIVVPGDRDCDGIPDGDDCKPEAYCDRNDPSPAAQAACRCN